MKIYFNGVKPQWKKDITAVFCQAMEQLGQPKKTEASVSFVSEEEIKRLNGQFRDTDSVTDVLSFPVLDNPSRGVIRLDAHENDVNPDSGNLILGDIVICPARAAEQAESYGHGLRRELCFLALHGLLHLLGYDHIAKEDEEQMTALQTDILESAGISRDTL